ncbi:AMP-binding protein [Acanthopleuribacter pedis]|uniref:AMP-binding protein n=1 Tax=Acanthopleuribacter pedis TaxID=442870 RepID=A0A8J7U222_9BACT|nr:AMP-binding protein [Acanthopleuribacter pedis]MBO1318152.1 AMP-binding protein [Acanthopleuribacter pedis]
MTSLSSVSTYLELLRWRAQDRPDHATYTFLEDGDGKEAILTNHELDIEARAIAAKLQSVARPGDRALLLFPPGLPYITALYGCLYAGVVAVPAYPPNRASLQKNIPRLLSIIEDAHVNVVLCNTDIHSMAASLFEDERGNGPHFIPTDQVSSDWAYDWSEPRVNAEDIAILQYTSGSTGKPKGVMLSHANILDNSKQISRCFGVHAGTVGVIWLPPYHDMGLIGGILQPYYSGIRVIMMAPFNFLRRPMRWLRAISRYRATSSGAPNFAYELCLQKVTEKDLAELDLSSWELAFNGAEPIAPRTLDRFVDTFGACNLRPEALYPCYGMAETTLILTGGNHREAHVIRRFDEEKLEEHAAVPNADPETSRALVGCGEPVADHLVEIVDPQTHERCEPGVIGEIWASGASIAQGYFNRPKLTEAVFQARLEAFPGRRFLRTGDLGFFQDDALFVTGRLKDLIIIRGRNYYPHDIERAVETCHPAIRSGAAAAFSVEIDGEEQLVLVQEILRKCKPDQYPEVVEVVRRTISEAFEVRAHGIVLIKQGSIAKTSSGKIRRSTCRQLFLDGELEVLGEDLLSQKTTGHDEVLCRQLVTDMFETTEPRTRRVLLTRLVSEILRGQPGLAEAKIAPHTTLSSVGVDSVTATEIANLLETYLEVDLPVVFLLEGPKIQEIAEELQALKWSSDAALLEAGSDRYADLHSRKQRGIRRAARKSRKEIVLS